VRSGQSIARRLTSEGLYQDIFQKVGVPPAVFCTNVFDFNHNLIGETDFN
jgi:hypothetical protein